MFMIDLAPPASSYIGDFLFFSSFFPVSQILSSLKRPVHTPQSSDTLLLDADNKSKVPVCNIRKSMVDNLTGEHYIDSWAL